MNIHARFSRFLLLFFLFGMLIIPFRTEIAYAAGRTDNAANATEPAPLPLEKIKLPSGFSIEVVARVPKARQMAWGRCGTLFVASFGDQVYALVPESAKPKVIARGLRMPVGVAFREGALYVSAVSKIVRLDNIENRLDNPPEPLIVRDDFPTDAHHGWKFIAFGPDGWLYVPVGAPCNICEPDREKFANIMRMRADGSDLETYAKGIRNSVGFDWNPLDDTLWLTNNGRDMMGDDLPPDTLHHAPRAGLDFGYPYCHGGNIVDPEFGRRAPGNGRQGKDVCARFDPPALKLGAHVAALGMRFYTGEQFPKEYKNNIFIAEHGSWNRSSKVGYRITRARVENGRARDYQPFATGWLQGESAWGRPADVLVAPDGSLLVSDDYAGAIYRISYGKSAPWDRLLSRGSCKTGG